MTASGCRSAYARAQSRSSTMLAVEAGSHWRLATVLTTAASTSGSVSARTARSSTGAVEARPSSAASATEARRT
jgi:hypothetical protein